MFNKKLKDSDLTELRNRQQMINEHFLIAQSLKDTLQAWINLKLKEYGFEDNKKFNISLKDGKIIEINEING